MLSLKIFQRPHVFLRIIGAAFIGALATCAFAPFSFWPAILLSIIGLFLLLNQQSSKASALIALAWGLGHFGTGISWVYVVIEKFGGLPTPVGLVLIGLLIFYLALYPALFGYLINKTKLPRVQTYLFLAPSLWLLIDWLRGMMFTGFPWLWAGYSQIESPFAGFAPIFGVQGITLAILLFSGAITLCLLEKKPYYLLLSAALVAVGLTGKKIQWVEETGKEVDVAMVQGNVPQELKWLPEYRWPTLLSYQDMTRANWDADLIIWPEAAVPAFENELPLFISRLDSAAFNNNTAIITGILDRDDNGKYFNNVITLGKNGTPGYQYPASQSYSKHHLLVFGEFVPFEDLLRPIAPLFNLPMSSFTAGTYQQPNLIANGLRLASAICYEIAFSEQVRANLTPESDFILTLSNDTWFGRSIGPHQHLEIAQMRALENGKPVLRSTNTGITAAINHQGQIIESIPQFQTEVLRTKVPTTEGQTPYYRWGNIPLYLWVSLSLAGLALLHRQRFKR